jgi:hypothetical protein
MKRRRWEPVQQCCEERSIGGGELRSSLAQLAFQDGDLVPQRQDLDVFAPIAHGEQAQ